MELRLQDRARQAIANRRAFPYLAAATAVLAVGAGIVVRLIDRRDFHSIGDGIWWAIVTLGTVGYGDIVPSTTWGRVLGSALIIFGVTFLSFLTATVTSLFLATDEDRRADIAEEADAERHEATHDALRRIEERLDAIEARLDARD